MSSSTIMMTQPSESLTLRAVLYYGFYPAPNMERCTVVE